MINSIQHFAQDGAKNLTEVFERYTDDLTKIAEMVQGVTDEMVCLGTSIIAEEWESYDELLRKRSDLRPGWHIVRKDAVTRTTSLGNVTYKRTLFKHAATGTSCYLLDQLMQMENHTRITEDAAARILEEAAESCYRKGGMNASITGADITKTTVMNKIHALEFPKLPAPDEKKSVRTLYIDADEDHVSLQYLERKGDIRKPRNNTAMPYIVYVYEGVETGDDGRPGLVCPAYFGGIYEGTEGVRRLWDEVYRYIENAYDVNALEKIYITGDGAAWIKSGAKYIRQASFRLDKYHTHKYIITATAHLGDSAADARSEIYRAIHKKKKWMAEGAFDHILAVTEPESKRKAVEAAKAYILGNWSGILRSMTGEDKHVGCSAEGHVSHIYADRMSSRPSGWCRRGADRMARLRVYRQNRQSMLELVRYQKKEFKMAAGAEEVVYSATQMISMENRNKERLGVLADMPVYSIPYPQIKKIAALKNHIWGL
ncbi:MAG: ISLre2 family transposase [Prevotella sp.]|nr:ISLre2 family transposase [Prevotella sp.]